MQRLPLLRVCIQYFILKRIGFVTQRIDVGVHPVCIGLNHLPGCFILIKVLYSSLRTINHTQSSLIFIVLNESVTQPFRKISTRGPNLQLHLKKAIACSYIPLRKIEIPVVLRENMGYSPPIKKDLNRFRYVVGINLQFSI